MAKTSLDMLLLIILLVDGFFLLGQTAVVAINPASNLSFFNYNDSTISHYDKDNVTYLLKDRSDGINEIPDSSEAVSETEGNLFTDTFKTISNWFKTTSGSIGDSAEYIWDILGGPTSYVNAINMPPVFVFVIGVVWYGVTFLLIISFILGRML